MNLSTGTVISQLPTGTIDNLQAIFPLSIGMPSSPQTIQASLAQLASQAMATQFQPSGTFSTPYSTSQLQSDINLTGSNGVYQEITGLSVTLPASGTYNLDAVVRGVWQENAAGGYINAKLYNSTDASDVTNSETLVLYYSIAAGSILQATVPIMTTYTVNGPRTIKLYAARTVVGVNSAAQIAGNSAGKTSIRYTQLVKPK